MTRTELQPVATKPERRWLRFTPDRLIGGLLVLEGLLLLSAHFRWFAFNQHKGWTVLIAVASVGAAMLLMLVWFAVALIFRWWFQFSIRSLLVLTVAVAILCSWLAVEMKKAREQKEAVEAIEELGGSVEYDYQRDASGQWKYGTMLPSSLWLRETLGDDFVTDAVVADLYPKGGLKGMKRSPEMEAWFARFRPVTDTDLVHLKALPRLRKLSLGPEITDAGLENLAELAGLQLLTLSEAHITDAGLARLKELTQLRELYVCETGITDAGLEHLKALPQLQEVNLCGTQVTEQGVKKLQQALPNCKIIWAPPTSDEWQRRAPQDQPDG